MAEARVLRTRKYGFESLYPHQKLGRPLLSNEVADHINNDKTDDRPENLQVLTFSENAKKEMNRVERKEEQVSFNCPNCGKEFMKPKRFVKYYELKTISGPYCSRHCAGKYTYKNPWK